MPQRLNKCSVLSWNPRAILPAFNALRSVCCNGSSAFSVQLQCLVSMLMQLRLIHHHRDFEDFFHVFRNGISGW
jgi:hypothetical protein